MIHCSSRTTPILTSTTSSTACRAWGRCGCSGPAITPCASGSSRMCWPNSGSPCPTSSPRSSSRARSTLLARWARRRRPRAWRRRTRCSRRGGSRRRRSLARSSSAPTWTAPSCACRTWPASNWRATLIPLIAVPVSLIGTFAVFPLLGFSINTLSMFAFVLAIGLVVDDAIVVVEAVEQHIERGLAPRAATAQAMREVSGPVVAIALILSSVFLPVAFMGGIQGRLNNQFAVTIVVSMLISAFNALTLSPALAALLLRPRQTSRGLLGRFYGGFNRGFEQVMGGYVDGSHFLIRKAVVGILMLAGFYIVDGFIGRKLPTSFLPEEDYGYFFMNVQLPPAASLARTDQVLHKIEAMLSTTEGVQSYNTISGFSLLTRISSSYQGFFFIGLTPWDERTAPQVTARAIVDRLNRALAAQVPEAVAFAFMPPAIPGLGNAGGFSFWLQDRSGGSVDFLHQHFHKL